MMDAGTGRGSWRGVLGATKSVGFLVLLAGLSCARQGADVTPTEYQRGEALFKASCARCHGERAVGTSQGPPLVHKIYEPNHHADVAFRRAAANGVRAHHWQFGDMPRIEGLEGPEVEQIIGYVRWLQRQAGIT